MIKKLDTPNSNYPPHAEVDMQVAGRVALRKMHTRSNGTGEWCLRLQFEDAETGRVFVGRIESWHVEQPTIKEATEWAFRATRHLGLTEGSVVLDSASMTSVDCEGDTHGLGHVVAVLPLGGRLGQILVDTSTDPDREVC